MNILQINNHFYNKGGADTVFLNTTALLRQGDHTVYTLSRQTQKDGSRTPQDFFIHTPELRFVRFWEKIKHTRSFFYNRESIYVLQKIIAEKKPDIAHIHLLYNGISPSILPLLKQHNIPVVMTVHDYRLICPNYWLLDKNKNLCEKCIDKHYIRCTVRKCSDTYANSLMLSLEAYYRQKIKPLDYINRFIFPSRFIHDKFIEFNPDYARNVDVLGNFSVDIQKHTENKGYFLFYGRLSREKGLPTLLQAAENLPNIRFKIAGAGPYAKEFIHRKRANIEFVGFQTGEELADLLHNAKFIVVPSEWYENNPMTIIEAMSAGKPVIGSRIGGIPELIENGRNGFLFEPKNNTALKAILEKVYNLPADKYAKLCQNAAQFASEHFQSDDYYQKLVTIYEKAIGRK